jgi:hypothetical protein
MYRSVIPRVYSGPLTFAVGHIEGYPLLTPGKVTPLILGLFHIHSMLGWFVPMVHVHEGKVGAQSDEYFISRSSR